MTPFPGAGKAEQLAQVIAERVVDLVLDAIDMDALLRKVDVDAIVRRVDVEDVINRVDVDAIIDRVDVQQIIDRVDITEIVNRVDIDALIEQTELGTIIARSTTGVFTEVLDVIRAQGVGLDDFLARLMNRILRRKPQDVPLGPPLLIATPEVS